MIINIEELNKKPEINFEEQTTVSLKNLRLGTNCTDCLVNVKGTITKEGTIYTLEGMIDTKIILLCDRCLDEFEYPIHADLYSRFSSDDEDEDVKPIVKSNIDLSEDILETIVVHLPMKCLCKEDCKGMCKKCGSNLNHKECKCDSSDIDLRLEQFKAIFDTSNQE